MQVSQIAGRKEILIHLMQVENFEIYTFFCAWDIIIFWDTHEFLELIHTKSRVYD